MKIVDALFKNTFLGINTKAIPGETQPGILVPVNSSASAFNSLHYALSLAKVLHTSIHLFYVTDVEDLPESTIVASRILDRLFGQAENCVESLRELIEESGIKVLTAESRVGNVGVLIRKRAEDLMPGLIVIGRDSFTKRTVNNLISHSAYPVLVVPASAPPRSPSSITLSAAHDTLHKKTLDPLLKIIQRMTQEFTILNIVKPKNQVMGRIQNHLTHMNGNLLANYYQCEDTEVIRGIDNFVQDNVVDLLCTIQGKRPLLKRIMNRNVSTELVYRLNIPVLVMRENA